jgi:hypothetical protein
MRARSLQAEPLRRHDHTRVAGLIHVQRNYQHQAEFWLEGLPLVLRLDRQQLIELKRGIAEAERRMGEIDSGPDVMFARKERLVF